MKRIGGIIRVKTGGILQQSKGEFSYNLGVPKREVMIGSDAVHGYKELPQVAFIEGAITDRPDLDLAALCGATAETVTIELANGKNISLSDGVFTGEGTVKTDEGEIAVRWESNSAKEF